MSIIIWALELVAKILNVDGKRDEFAWFTAIIERLKAC